MSASSRTNWFWSDWLGDQAVRRLTPAERGVWIDLLALMAAAAPTGYLCDEKGRPLLNTELGRVCNCSEKEMADYITGILDKGAASRDRTGRLFCRRMVREAEMSARRRLNGKPGGAATRLKWQHFSSVPGDLPGDLPGAACSPLSNKKDNSFFLRTPARDRAPQQKADLRGRKIGPPSEDLEETVKRKGWTNGK